ncbi:hypothetical protein ZHAS_00011383 [Anopheles sinensis]|uniref:Uncharacterized protein n=1 Tax=Anopheles sinensis TaxID=74873 RepID=A0A084W0B3_ANOSI|nr:hypothetical protein ZHAS_00011383 [Anopheles sinensis]
MAQNGMLCPPVAAMEPMDSPMYHDDEPRTARTLVTPHFSFSLGLADQRPRIGAIHSGPIVVQSWCGLDAGAWSAGVIVCWCFF